MTPGVTGPDALAARIAAIRRRLGLSQAAFADLVGVGRNMVIRWEHGPNVPARPGSSASRSSVA